VGNLYQVFEESGLQYSDHTALTFNQNHVSYSTLIDAAGRLATGLQRLGLQKGERIAVMLPNIPHYPMAFLACLKLGIVLVPVPVASMSPEIHILLEDSEVSGILFWEGYRDKVVEAVRDLEHCKHMLVLGERAGPNETRVNYLMETSEPSAENVEVDDDWTAVVMYTAGTTGTAKGAELSHGNIRSSVEILASFLKIGPDDSVPAILPFSQALGQTLVMGTFLKVGARLVLHPYFDAGGWIRILEQERCTCFIGVPAMFQEILEISGEKSTFFQSVRLCLSSGDSLKQEVLELFESRFKTAVLEGYGLTEACSLVTLNSTNRERKAGSIGLTLPGIDLKIVDESGEEIRAGQIGEILVRGPNVMKGYLNRPAATEKTLRDGWLHTGDLALLHEDGYAAVVVRKKAVIIKSGFSVYPREVEKFIAGHPGVSDVAVVGLPDKIYGEEIYACVIPRNGEDITEKEIIEYARERIAAYKCPKKVHFCETLPRGPNGRIQRERVKNLLMNVYRKH